MTRIFLHSLLVGGFAVMVLLSNGVHAGYTYDFESSLENWGPSGFGSGASQFVNLSATGATQGSAQAMEFGHVKQSVFPASFSWDASVLLSPGDPAYQALSNAYSNPVGKTLDLDFTWDASLLPASGWTFANTSVSVQDDNAFRQIDGLAGISFGDTLPVTTTLSLPLDSGNLAGGIGGSGFYRITIAVNVDAAADATVGAFADNITITPEPTSFALLGIAGVALGLVRRQR